MVIPRDLSFVSTVFIPSSAFSWDTLLLPYGPSFAKITILVPDGTRRFEPMQQSPRCVARFTGVLDMHIIAFGLQHFLQLCRPSLVVQYAEPPSYLTGT